MKNGSIFQQFWFVRLNYNSKATLTCFDKSDQYRWDNWNRKKKRTIKIEFWHTPELMAHLEDDLYFYITHSLLLIKNDSIEKTLYHEHNKT